MWAGPTISGDTPTLPDHTHGSPYQQPSHAAYPTYLAPYPSPYGPAYPGVYQYQAPMAGQPPHAPYPPHYSAPYAPPNAAPYATPSRRSRSRLSRVGNKLAQVVTVCSEIVTAVLILRIVLLYLSASSLTPFSQLVAVFSTPLVLPFAGLFPPILFFSGQVDLSAVVALVAYALAARVLESFVRLVTHW